jgi:energy-coupling factor transporter ATP-binding protein EcfA2
LPDYDAVQADLQATENKDTLQQTALRHAEAISFFSRIQRLGLDTLLGQRGIPNRWIQQWNSGINQFIRQRQAVNGDMGDLGDAQQVNTITVDDLLSDPEYINPAQCFHNGRVYTLRTMLQVDGAYFVDRPVVITSDRQVLRLPTRTNGAPDDAVLFLNNDHSLAMRGIPRHAGCEWSFESVQQFLSGNAPQSDPYEIFKALKRSLRSYVFFRNDHEYNAVVLWVMATYFFTMFDSFPYLAIHGHKGSGKSTLLHWLSWVVFNPFPLVNSSEASLYRMIEAQLPTMLIDEQEGLNSRKAGRENKADLMGILKAGYQKRTGKVARQDMANPERTRIFDVYCPKALAAIECFEDILEDRSILIYLHQPTEEEYPSLRLRDRSEMGHADFQPLRDALYLLMMQSAPLVEQIYTQIRADRTSQLSLRLRDLATPLHTLAALVDNQAGNAWRINLVVDIFSQQVLRRKERDDLTPEAMLQECLGYIWRTTVVDAPITEYEEVAASDAPLRLADDRVIADVGHIAEVFDSLFPTSKESFFTGQWLGRQAGKTDCLEIWRGPGARNGRWKRTVQERDEATGELIPKTRHLTTYCILPQFLSAAQKNIEEPS